MWERISCVYLRPGRFFYANFCPVFIVFPQPEIQSGIDRSLPTPPTNVKRLEPTNPCEVFTNSWVRFTKRPCLNFGFYPVLIACLQTEIDTGESSRRGVRHERDLVHRRQKSKLKFRNPSWNPEIHCEIQKSKLKSRNPSWNPEIHSKIRKSNSGFY